MSSTVIVPCYNEEKRLDLAEFERFLAGGPDRLLFVDDGSKDDTARILSEFAARHPGRAELLKQEKNGGKAEAVRAGLAHALGQGAELVAYLDADLSTPVDEMQRLLDFARTRGAKVVMGSRIRLLGNEIERRLVRHLLGRVFATAASMALGLRVYDTQCGAKVFVDSAPLRKALETPFEDAWAFDVELIGRLLWPVDGSAGLVEEDFLEVPLKKWVDVAGSKLGGGQMVKAGLSVLGLFLRLERRRRDRGAA